MQNTEPYKGVRDFYPEDEAIQRYIFDTWAWVAESFGYQRYDASILEPAELYRAKTSEEIVNEQTYTFTDRGDREVTLRPEMTPTVARMVAARRRELSFPLRWYSIPNLFRYERPQRGRLREHWQLNCDIFGADSLDADTEIISLVSEIFRTFGATENDFHIKINNRVLLEKTLTAHLTEPGNLSSAMRLLDRKEKMSAADFATEAVALFGESGFPDIAADETITAILERLNALGITNVSFDSTVVRGFDYYTGTVFEIFDTDPKNNRALLGGGRYNNLAELFNTEPIAAVGFGMGDVTMRDFLVSHELLPELRNAPEVMLALVNVELAGKAQIVAQPLRESGISVAINFSGKKIGDQIKQADKLGTPHIITIGEDELTTEIFTLKTLATGAEATGTLADIAATITNA